MTRPIWAKVAATFCLILWLGMTVQPGWAAVSVKNLLTKAQAAEKAKRLTTPRKTSAVTYYRQVLAVDPKNAKAKAGLKRVASIYLGWVDRDLAAGKLDKAEIFLNRLESIDPNHPRLMPLRTRIANDRLAADLALERAEEALKAGDPAGATVQLARAERVLGRTAEYKSLRKKIRSKLGKIEAELERLIDKAAEALARRQYILAYQTCRRARQLSPGEPRLDDLERAALAGLGQLESSRADDYLDRAMAALEQGQTAEAEKYLAWAELLRPDHPRLDRLAKRQQAEKELEIAASALEGGDLNLAQAALGRAEPHLPGDPRLVKMKKQWSDQLQIQDQGRRLLARAEVNLAAGRLNEADEAITQAAKLLPGDPKAAQLAAALAEARRTAAITLLGQAGKAIDQRKFDEADGLLDRAVLALGEDERIDDLRAELAALRLIEPPAGSKKWTSPHGLEMVFIPAGFFLMGSESGFNVPVNESPRHRVVISKPFRLAETEITRGQWRKVMEPAAALAEDDQLPKAGIGYEDALAFIRRLNHLEQTDRYALPTEAQWEYACRATTNADWSFGDSGQDMGDYGWYMNNSLLKLHPVGQKKPNPWGLYDMHGNVQEICADFYSDDYYDSSPEVDPAGPKNGQLRAARGGSFLETAGSTRCAIRVPGAARFNMGFRILRRE